MRLPSAARIAAIVLTVAALSAAPARAQQSSLKIVASTGLTAAFVKAAGAENVTVLTPFALVHPPEYELKPGDIATVQNADVIVYGGYEIMVKKMTEAVGNGHARLVKIDTDFPLATIRASVMAIAHELGTEKAARANIAEISRFFDDWRADLKARGVEGATAVVQLFQLPLAKELGFRIVGKFGPGPLEARQIETLSQTGASVRFILDNEHNKVGGPLIETMPNSAYVSLINFPPSADRMTLIDILSIDRGLIDGAIK